MADWEQLREIGREATPPPFEALAAEARRRDRRARVVVGTATLAVVSALGLGVALADGDEDAGFQPAQDPSRSISTPSDAGTPKEAQPLPVSIAGQPVSLGAGRYRVELTDTLAFAVDVPAGTSSHEDGLFLATRGFVLKTEAAGERYGVPQHPCSAQHIDAVGPTMDDLVDALTDLPVYQTTRPEPVELGGADGVYIEAQVPRTYDASPCDDGAVQLPGNPSSAVAGPPPYVGRWWVLDVDGQRVVIQQNCWGCGTEVLADDATMAQSITFTPTP